ncbi:hypothetical protein HYH02_010929 [Chlamydomonas schloesseri]|uniref:Uncharacterized protein n=1 Tax=Chlamydomonas schloesseri TaxID=2026947 RepID=A0A835T8D4_9CHLO|nr:hypothetical protein HYH02_010929 [Chlamydomonas schloesseri]|eukprot:KAG2438228.1 hypothetical protein HYH02_010929 [Chlamydomonas schloesseri]
MPVGALINSSLRCGSSALPLRRQCFVARAPAVLRRPIRQGAVTVRASASDGSAPMMPEPEGPREISLTRRVPGVGYTFMLAGALKIMTVGWIATSAPRECVRTVAGQYAQFLLLPVGLLLCLIAKKIVDAGLHESKRFMAFVLGLTAFAYVGLYPVLYRYEPKTYYAQQRLIEAATHQPTRSPYADETSSTAAANRNKFIVQRQLEGEYDNRLPSYYSRAPEMQMADVNDRVGSLPDGMLGAATVGSTTAERRLPAGTAAVGSRAPRRVGGANVPSMYETQSRIPGLDDSEF